MGYKRLSKRRAFLGVHALYMADDHLLAIDGQGFSESYRRFYFSDIRTIVIRKTMHWPVWNIILASLATISLIGLWLQISRVPLLISFMAFLVFLVFNLSKGPSCVYHITTAVQEERLPSIRRLKKALKITETIRLAVEQAQGSLTPDEIRARVSDSIDTPARRRVSFVSARTATREIVHDDGIAHFGVYGLMLFIALMEGVQLFYHASILPPLSFGSGALCMIALIVALVRQHIGDIPGTLRKVTWASLGFICALGILSSILLMAVPFIYGPEAMKTMTEVNLHRMMIDVLYRDTPFFLTIRTVCTAIWLVLGVSGLVLTNRHRAGTLSEALPDQTGSGETDS